MLNVWMCKITKVLDCLLAINKVSATSGNTGNLLEFNCSSWKFLYNRFVI